MHQKHVISSFIQTDSLSLLTIIVFMDMTAEKQASVSRITQFSTDVTQL